MGQSSVKSAERALDVLSFLSAQAAPVFASNISRAIGLPKSSTYHLLNVMRDRGFVTYFPQERLWGIGAAARDIGSAHPKANSLRRLARPIMERLVEVVRDSVVLCVPHGAEVVVIARIDPPGEPLPGVPGVGARVRSHLSAYGRAVLASEPEHTVRSLFPASRELMNLTGRGPRRRSDLLALLSEQAGRGFTSDDSEWHRGTSTVAAAVRDYLGFPVASIGVTFWSPSKDPTAVRALGGRVNDSAERLSASLGFERTRATIGPAAWAS